MDLADALGLARDLVAEHGLTGWRVTLDRAKRRAGVTRFDSRVIGLSAPLTALAGEDEVRDTILHEIAHALVGPRHGHDATWRRTALSIGCSGERCVPADAPRPVEPWQGTCPAGHTAGRHRRPERVVTCARCAPGRFDLAHLLTWSHHGRPATAEMLHPNYLAELERLAAGQRMRVLGPGQRARIIVGGRYAGSVGTVVKRGRTRYHLRVGRQVLTVPFAGVEPV
ncbi:SprT-like domain-containing protein [Nocardioides bruguierae]|uniref:SprT-like domain-containing protein n=1 Tax=Nocardioides bruguierae TaxID=2945102 RepID=A0A9X2IFV2_9ACTN|nr:SprT-like domain-containing protein [Nocardioides bruguierae]MCM0620125.1 SprT-like domain-containing protein [Nocardioides bruguierae]